MSHRRITACAIGLVAGVPAAMVDAQATLDHDQLTNGVGVLYYDWPGQNFHAGTDTHASPGGVDYSDELKFGWSEDGLAGQGRAVQTTVYDPSNPGLGGPFGSIAVDMYGEAEITASNYENHFTEQTYGNPDNFIWFHLDNAAEWHWEADVAGSSTDGYDNNGFYIFILYDSNFGNIFSDSVSSHNGKADFKEHRTFSGKLEAGDYIINVAAGGNVGNYRLGGVGGIGAANGSISNGLFALDQDSCAPDLDGNGTLDLFDFLAFVNLFNASDPAADCDENGVFDLFDFLCFVNAFNAGC